MQCHCKAAKPALTPTPCSASPKVNLCPCGHPRQAPTPLQGEEYVDQTTSTPPSGPFSEKLDAYQLLIGGTSMVFFILQWRQNMECIISSCSTSKLILNFQIS